MNFFKNNLNQRLQRTNFLEFNVLSAIVFFLFVLSYCVTSVFAQESVKQLNPEKVTYIGTYRYSDKTLTPSKISTQQDIIFNNTTSTGAFYSTATPDERVQDWGESPGGMVTGIQIGYATSDTGTVDITILFYEGTTESDTGDTIATLPISGLPGSSSGNLVGLSVDIDLTGGDEFELPAGAFGYAYNTADDDGPLTATGGQGATDFFRVLPDTALQTFTGSTLAQFWMQITGEANEVILPDPPANDECDSATVVLTFPFSDTLDTRGATNNPADPMLSCNADGMQTDGNTVWYTWTPSADNTVNISTDGSNYDTAIGVYTGACGDLTEVGCADTGIEDNLVFTATGGVLYFIKIGEFQDGSGGGDLVFSIGEPPSLFQGPANGSIANGASISTDDFGTNASGSEKPKLNLKNPRPTNKKSIFEPTASVGSNFVEDLSGTLNTKKTLKDNELNAPVLQKGFEGIPDLGVGFPPDPHMAAGPNHIMGTINSIFGIWDKDGNLLKLIDADDWFANVHPDGGTFDPQIVYDHHDDRWVMIYIATEDTNSTLLLSVSDDSDPLGTWCNWSIPGNQNGSTPNSNLNDYPKIGIDDEAIYVSSNQFDLPTFEFLYSKIRIIGKAQLYDNNCGPVTFTDFWDLRNPSLLGAPTFTTVPAVTFASPGVEYFVDVDPIFQTGTFMNLWSLTDPIGTPTLTAVTVPVTAFTSPPNADQRGGSTTLIDVGGRRNRNVVYQDGFVWTAHSVADETGQFAHARYAKINVATGMAVEDVAFGREDFWYSYPAVQPDGDGNLVMGFTRSGLTEYASARYTGRLTSDDPGLQPSALLKAGEANYVKTGGGDRNRWGDYNGIALDPADSSKVWMFIEYAASPENTYGTWFGTASFTPLSGPQIVFDPDSIEFDAIAIGDTTLPVLLTVQNSGDATLTVTDISLGNSAGNFILDELPALPLDVDSFQGFEFTVAFTADADILANDVITITSNDADNSTVTIPLEGKTPAKALVSTTSIVAAVTDIEPATSVAFSLDNIGGDDLDFQIGFTGIAEFTPAASVSLATKPGISFNKSTSGPSLADFTPSELSKLDLNSVNELNDVVQATPANTLFQYDVSTPSGDIFVFAVEFDGTNIWAASGGQDPSAADANRLLKYDINGNFIEAFDQGNGDVSTIGWRDMAFDGTNLYGLDQEAAQIDEFDIVTGAPTGVTIASPDPSINLRALGYDPATDHFWLSGLGLNLFEIDRSGNVINEFTNTDGLNIRGLGWDDVSIGGPYLWAWADGDETTRAHLFDPVAGEFTGLTFDGALLGDNTSGGATFTTDLPTDPPNTPVLIGLHQNVPDFDVAAAYAIPPFWLVGATPDLGGIASNGSQDIEVSIDASDLENGSFVGGIVVGTNDPDQPSSVIEVNLTKSFASSVSEEGAVPTIFSLEQNYPNPFNPETKIRYSIPQNSDVNLTVYNMLGQIVRELVNEHQIANSYETIWDGKNSSGEIMPSAVYVFQLKAGNKIETRKLLLLK